MGQLDNTALNNQHGNTTWALPGRIEAHGTPYKWPNRDGDSRQGGSVPGLEPGLAGGAGAQQGTFRHPLHGGPLAPIPIPPITEPLLTASPSPFGDRQCLVGASLGSLAPGHLYDRPLSRQAEAVVPVPSACVSASSTVEPFHHAVPRSFGALAGACAM
jgi:hypothetical protein